MRHWTVDGPHPDGIVGGYLAKGVVNAASADLVNDSTAAIFHVHWATSAQNGAIQNPRGGDVPRASFVFAGHLDRLFEVYRTQTGAYRYGRVTDGGGLNDVGPFDDGT